MRGFEFGLIALLAGAWMLQIWLSSRQMRRYHQRSMQLKKLGSYLANGVSGNMYRRKVYAAVVADDAGIVRGAEALSGFTVFADSKPVPQVVGIPVSKVGEGQAPEGVDEKTWKALGHAASFIRAKVSGRTLEGAPGATSEEDSP